MKDANKKQCFQYLQKTRFKLKLKAGFITLINPFIHFDSIMTS